MKPTTRRQFLRQSSRTAAGALLLPTLLGCGTANDAGQPTSSTSTNTAPAEPQKQKLGIALLGLGGYAKGQIAPALQLTEHCELRGLITGSPEKLPKWRDEWGVRETNCYTYDRLTEVADNDDIDVIYVITPTATHKDFTIRAAEAGKHVWCEKPMAMTPEDCREMIAACERNGVTLSIGYRMLHEPNTRQLIDLTENRTYGALTGATAHAGYGGNPPPTDYWRGQRHMGGGALYDMGVYAVNGLRYGTGMMPEAVVRATQQRMKNADGVDLTTEFTLRFPGGLLAGGKTSVVTKYNLLRIEAENGWYELSPMQSYTGVAGRTSDGKVLGPPVPNQQSLQMDHDARAILDGTPRRAPGEEGLRDVRIIRAIIESAETGREVKI